MRLLLFNTYLVLVAIVAISTEGITLLTGGKVMEWVLTIHFIGLLCSIGYLLYKKGYADGKEGIHR